MPVKFKELLIKKMGSKNWSKFWIGLHMQAKKKSFLKLRELLRGRAR